jgi:hypothetical protein
MNKLILKKLTVVAVTLVAAVSVTRAFAQTSQVEPAPTMPMMQGAQAGSDMVEHCNAMMRHVKLDVAPRADAIPQSWQAPDNASSVGKTRAQVQAELLQAEEAGVVPISNHTYPGGEASVIRSNQYRFASAERAWKGHTDADAQ